MKRITRIRENLRHCSFHNFNRVWSTNGTTGRQSSILSPYSRSSSVWGAWKATTRNKSLCFMRQKVSTSIHAPHLYSFLDKSILCRARSCKAMLLAESGAFSNDKSLAKPIHLSDLSRWWSTKLKIMYQFYTSLRPLPRPREIFHILF